MKFRYTKQMREIIPHLEQNGFRITRKKGSHFIFKDGSGNEISVNKDLNKMVKRKICKSIQDIQNGNARNINGR